MTRLARLLASAAALAALAHPALAAERPIELAALFVPPETVAAAPAPRPTITAVIDLSDQKMELTIARADTTELYRFPVSTGRTGYATPPGTFQPTWLNRMHYSKKYDNAPMPYAVFFNGGIAVHGTEHVRRLGSPASHGCVRLDTANARLFFAAVKEIGREATTIIVQD